MTSVDIRTLDFDSLTQTDCATLIGVLAERLQSVSTGIDPADMAILQARRKRMLEDPSSTQSWEAICDELLG